MRSIPVALATILSVGFLSTGLPASASDASVSGRITTASGAGVSGAQVRAVGGSSTVAAVTTSADGSYGLDVPAGTYSIEVTPNVPQLASATAIWVEAPRTTSLDFILTEPNPGRVRVTASINLDTGEAVGGGNLLFAGAGNRVGSDGFVSMLQPSGGNGGWMLSGTAAIGSQTLNILASGGPTTTLVQDTDIDFTIPVTRTTVTVRGNDGAPLANASVVLNAGGWDKPASSVEIIQGLTPFRVTWTARARTDASGSVTLVRPALTASTPGTLSIEGPDTTWAGSFTDVTIPATAGEFGQSLQLRIAPTPSPTPSAKPSPTPSPTPSPALTSSASPSPTSTPIWYAATGTIKFSNGTPVVGAIIIPTDPSARVNGGNSSDASGAFRVLQPAGFTGHWVISSRAQAGLAVRDPMTFSLKGGATRTWTADQRVDFTIPTTLYRIRVVDSAGTPVPNVRVAVGVLDAAGNEVRLPLIAGEPEFSGRWGGWDITGPDGFAQVPGFNSSTTVQTQISVDADPQSRFVGQTLTRPSSALSETVIVLQGRLPVISSLSRTTASPGDTITVTGQNFIGTQRVLIGTVPQEFTVNSATQITMRVTSNSSTGNIRIENTGAALTGERVTITSANLQITSASLPTGMVGRPYQAALTTEGGLAPFTWTRTAGSLPTGLTISSTGVVSGTPTRALTGQVTLAVTDARGATVSRVMPRTIDPRPATAPGPVIRLRVTAGADRVSLAWNLPASDGGNTITGYQVQSSTNGSTWTTEIPTTGTISLGTSIPAPAGVPRWYRVAAVNAAGVGAYDAGSVTGPVTAFTVPSAPTNLRATRTSSTQIRISWDPPTANNGAEVTGYRIRTSTDGTNWTTAVASTNQRSATLRVTAGANIWVQVSAQNVAGLGPWTTREVGR